MVRTSRSAGPLSMPLARTPVRLLSMEDADRQGADDSQSGLGGPQRHQAPARPSNFVTGVAALNENVISKEDGSIKNVLHAAQSRRRSCLLEQRLFPACRVSFGNAKDDRVCQTDTRSRAATGLAIDGEYAGKLPVGNNNPASIRTVTILR